MAGFALLARGAVAAVGVALAGLGFAAILGADPALQIAPTSAGVIAVALGLAVAFVALREPD